MRPLRIPAYPHFDGPLSHGAAYALVLNPNRVAAHRFLPLLRHRATKYRFRKGTPVAPGKLSYRAITYAGRRDSVIFRRYRDVLYELYETLLRREDLDACVLAYRSISSPGGHCKSNIDFAVETYNSIRQMGDCTVLCLDIKSFFDSIGHEIVLETWKNLLGTNRLPEDHFAVMTAATKYSFVEEKIALGALGFFGSKLSPTGAPVRGYLVPRRSLPLMLCDKKTFIQKIAMNVNKNKVGIPQGLPISDVLANAVLLQFDRRMKERCKALGGLYRRYSDDLLFVLPGTSVDPGSWIREVDDALGLVCRTLKLGHDKTCAYKVERLATGGQQITPIRPFKVIPTIDYLGLSYDGRSIYLRQSTLSRLKGRIVRRVRRQVLARLQEWPTATANQILSSLHLEGIMREFGRIEAHHRNPKTSSRGPKKNFYCYAVRASKAGGLGVSQILKQISDLKSFIRLRARREISKLRP